MKKIKAIKAWAVVRRRRIFTPAVSGFCLTIFETATLAREYAEAHVYPPFKIIPAIISFPTKKNKKKHG